VGVSKRVHNQRHDLGPNDNTWLSSRRVFRVSGTLLWPLQYRMARRENLLRYIAEHPQFLPDKERAALREMAAQGARRCPNCHCITVKDGGCEQMICNQCSHDYIWQEAERLKAQRLKAPRLNVNVDDTSETIESFRTQYDLHSQEISLAEVADDPGHNFLAYITYDAYEDENDQYEEMNEDDIDNVESGRPYVDEECEMNVIRAVQLQTN
jgi:hypothetical protein